MKLTLNNIHHYLMHTGILPTAAIVCDGYCARKRPENRGMFQIQSGERHLFVKQVDGSDYNSLYRLQRDATSLFLFQNEPIYSKLKPYTAEYFGYHVEYQSMVTAFFEKTSTLDEFYRKNRNLEDRYLDNIIDIFSILHQDTATHICNNSSLQFFPQQFPWLLNLSSHPLLEKAQVSTAIEMMMQHIIRIDGITGLLEKARAKWQILTLIHGDIKYNNFLIDPTSDKNPVKIIDWEYADIGDPLWDLAGLFQNIICNRILIHFHLNEMGMSRENIDLEVRTVVPRIARLWKLYCSKIKSKIVKDERALETVLQYTAMRMLQTAIELNMNDTSIQVNTFKVIDTSMHISNNLTRIENTIKVCI